MSLNMLRKQKSAVRKRFLEIRNTLSLSYLENANQLIYERVIKLNEFINANSIHIYASMSDRNEVDTYRIMDKAFSMGKRVIVPVMKKDGVLIHAEINSSIELEKNNWGVPEPEVKKEADPALADIVFVPMLAGDKDKNRMGYGKGYYDRFLKKIECPKVGLLFETQLSEDPIPVGKFDEKLDILITDKQIIQ